MPLDLLFATASRRRMGKPPFSPSSIAGLQGWYDAGLSPLWQDSARTTAATADGDPVGAWDDLSGNGRHLIQATAAARPTLKAGIQNGLPVVRYDGVDDELVRVAFSQTQPLTIYAMGKQTSKASEGRFVDGNNGRAIVDLNMTTGVIRMFAGGGVVTSGTGDHSGVFLVLGHVYDGASSAAYLNGGLDVSGNPGTGGIGDLVVGSDGGNGAQHLNGDIGTVLVYSGAHDASQVAQLFGYLDGRWAVP